MSSPAIVTLTTDFGAGSSYVGEMKGALLCGAPHATIVDLFHGVAPQYVIEGAIRLESCFFFPPGTIHIAVVDPGVGAGRAVLFARIRDQRFIAPDNGLLSWIASQADLQELRRIENRSLFRPNVSKTFEGRDVMASVAAALIRGVPPEDLGPATTEMVRLDFPRPQLAGDEIAGEILYLDSYGNAVTNIRRSDVPPDRPFLSGETDGAWSQTFVETYAQGRDGQLVFLFGSSDRLEFAVVNGSAAKEYGLRSREGVRFRLAMNLSSEAELNAWLSGFFRRDDGT